MKNRVFTLNINNYFPELMEITIPLMEEYADKIGAEFIEIKERKFPDWHIHNEKLQIYELGKDSEWNIFFDGDLLVHPKFQDLTKSEPTIFIKDGYSNSMKYKPNKHFLNDRRNQGIASCLLASHIKYHNIWKPLDMTPDEVTDQIVGGKDEDYSQNEFILSYNLAKYQIPYNGLDQTYIYHSYETDASKEIKLKEIKSILDKWQIKTH